MSMKTKHAQRISSKIPPPSGREPRSNMTPRGVEELIEKLREYHSIYAHFFKRKEQRHWSLQYLWGQMLDIKRKSIEPMANALEEGNVQAMQQFISAGPWDDQPIILQHQKEVAKTLANPQGVLILDGCDFPKQGKHSAGVARQYCGPSGKVDNCQAGVFLAYAGDKGHTLLDRRLFMPEKWFSPEYKKLRETCDVPKDLAFQTKNELSWDMIEALIDNNHVPFQYITMDEAFGRDSALLKKIARKNKYYFAEIPCSICAWTEQPKMKLPVKKSKKGRRPTKLYAEPAAKRVDSLAFLLEPKQWRRAIIHEGSKGPMQVDIAVIPAIYSEDKLPGNNEWLIIRRKSSEQPIKNWKFYRCNAPANTLWEELARLTAWRWPIESTFEECKGELGMDHYEVRNWRGWHHHITMTMLSHHFLVRVRVNNEDGAPALTVSQVRRLLQVVLPKRTFDAKSILQEIQRTQTNNYKAYLSHRKRRTPT